MTASTPEERHRQALRFIAGYRGSNKFVRRLKDQGADKLSRRQVSVVLTIRQEESHGKRWSLPPASYGRRRARMIG